MKNSDKSSKYTRQHQTAIDLVEKLTKLRHDNGISQRELAKRMFTTQSAISGFEQHRNEPRFSSIFHYANALGYHISFTIVSLLDNDNIDNTDGNNDDKSRVMY